MLVRAGACARLVPDQRDVAYTAGLLSAVADLMGTDPAATIVASGVHASVAEAVLQGSGPVGVALRAVLSHERLDTASVAAAGLPPFQASQIYLDALREARETVSAFGS